MSLKHDSAYRDFFSNKRVVEDLLRAYVGQDWIELLDFSSLQRVNASYVHAAERQRTSDVVWRLRLQGSGDWVYLYLRPLHNLRHFRRDNRIGKLIAALLSGIILGIFNNLICNNEP